MNASGKVLRSLRRDGLSGLSRKAALYLSRGARSRTGAWSTRLGFEIDAANVQRANSALLARNEIFRDRHKGRRCFVIGNGPSLNAQNLSPLAGELTFVTNSFYKHPTLDEWQPDYYFMSDPCLFDDTEAAREFSTELRAHVRESTYFVPHKFRTAVEANSILKPDETYYVGLVGNLADDLPWRPDFTRVLPDVRTVAQFAIMGALFMGCSPIYLLGMDHDWLAHTNVHYNFYTSEAGEQHDWGYGDLMEAVLVMWRGYESIRKVAGSEGARIFNATPGSFLDVFERADYESIIR
jgi:hypothetical protein